MPKINKRLVDSLLPSINKYFIWDSDDGAVKGFGLVVFPSGSKSFVFQYRNEYARTERMTIGKYGDLTPDQARKAARDISSKVIYGENPAAEKKQKRAALTLNELLDEYLKSEKFDAKAASTKATDRGRIDRHIRPLLGTKIAETITSDKIRGMFSDIRDGKTACNVKTGYRGRAVVTGGEGAARMACRVLRAIYSWAQQESLMKHNPCSGVPLGKDGTRETILSTNDYPKLFITLETLVTEQVIRLAVADIIRILALTGARKNEIAALKWGWVDLKAGIIRVPASAHKTGSKMGSKVLSLPTAAQVILSRQPLGADDDFVFPPSKGNSPISLSKPWRLIREEAGLPEGIGLHGLRHSVASLMAVQGAEAPQIMAALGHTQMSTTQRYITFADESKRSVLEHHTAGIAAALEGHNTGKLIDLWGRAKYD